MIGSVPASRGWDHRWKQGLIIAAASPVTSCISPVHCGPRGLPVGPGRTLEALRAVEAVGVGSREDLYWTLHSVLVNRRDQRELFDQAFHIFWRDPQLLERMMHLLLPQLEGEQRRSSRM